MRRGRRFIPSSALVLLAWLPAVAQEGADPGWCCRGGQITRTSERQCLVNGGQYFLESTVAQAECTGAGSGEIREGWCCAEGAVVAMTDAECRNQGGSFSAQRDAAEGACGAGRPRPGGQPGSVITVTTTADSGSACAAGAQGTCSLREAIRLASQRSGAQTIRFSLGFQDPGYDATRGAWVLRFSSPLPVLRAHGATVDGGSLKSPKAPSLPHAPPGCPRPAVELDGTGIGMGLLVQGNQNTVQGLAIHGFSGPGIRFEGHGNTLRCSYLGTDIAQQSGKGNGNGVAVRGGGNNNHIGIAGGGNLISGNTTNGVLVAGGCSNTSLEGNLIGVKGDGKTALPNGNGVALEEGSHHTRIGGAGNRSPGRCDGSCNVISGNNGHGVQIGKSDSNVVVANFIGVSADGRQAVGNRLAGVWMLGSRFNRVGGGISGLGNVISGNRDGVVVQGVADRKPWDNTVEGNLIGTDASATSPLPNQGAGVLITVGADKNVVGGSPNQGNVIAGNRLAGVRIDRGSSLNHVTNNWIGTNRDGRMLSNGQGVALYRGARLNWIGGPQGTGNIISYNNGDGVHIEGQQTVDNGIASNSIFGNLGKGISLVDGGNRVLPTLRIWETNLIDPARNEYYVVGQLHGVTPASPDYRVAIYSDSADEGRWVENPLVVVAKAQQNLRFGWFGAKAVLRGNRFTYTVSDHLGHNTSEFQVGNLKPAGQGSLPFDMDYWQVDPDNHIPVNPHYHGGWGTHPRWTDIRKLSKVWSWDGGFFIKCAEGQVSPGAASHYRGFLCGYFLTYHQTVMFTGDIYWESYMDDGTPGFEDTDNNFGLLTPGMAGVHLNSQRYIDLDNPDPLDRLECPGGSVCDARDWKDKLGDSFHIGNWVNQTRYYPLLTLEINRKETFDNWGKHTFWGRLAQEGPHLKPMINAKKAMAIGRWAMDGYHHCRSEIHPVFGMAIRDSATTENGPGREVWHFFMRRDGDQAVCGGWAQAGGSDWYFRFKGRSGQTPTATVTDLLSNNWSGGVRVSATGPHSGGDVVLKMHLPDTDDRVCGTITIDWK